MGGGAGVVRGLGTKARGLTAQHGRSCLPLGPLGAVRGRREHQAQAVGGSHPAAQWDLGSARMEQGCGLRASLPVPQLPQASGPSTAPEVELWSLESEAQPPPTHQPRTAPWAPGHSQLPELQLLTSSSGSHGLVGGGWADRSPWRWRWERWQ